MENTKAEVLNMYAGNLMESDDCVQLDRLFKEIKTFKGTLDTKDAIINCLKIKEKIEIKIEKLSSIINLKVYSDIMDMDDLDNIDFLEVIRTESKRIDLEIIKEILSKNFLALKNMFNKKDELGFKYKIDKMRKEFAFNLSDEKNYNEIYKDFLDIRGDYRVLLYSIKIDKILTSKGETFYCKNIYEAFEHLKSEDRIERQTAFNAIVEAYEYNMDDLLDNYMAMVELISKLVMINTRNFRMKNAIGFDNLDEYNRFIKKIKSKLYINHKFFEVKRNLLNLSCLHKYDKNVSVIPTRTYSLYSYEEAKEILINSVEVLGKQYQEDIRKGLEEKWNESISKSGKYPISFTVNVYESHPYINQNYDGKIIDIDALAHEFGHAINFYYKNSNNSFYSSNSNVIINDVFALVTEFLTKIYLIENESDLDRKANAIESLVQYINYSTIDILKDIEFKQWIFENVNKFNYFYLINETDKKDVREKIADKFIELEKEYNGSSFENINEMRYVWLSDANFNEPFISFKYSISTMIAISIIKNLKLKGEAYRVKYIEALKQESENSFYHILQDLDIDLDSEDLINNFFDFYEDMINQYKKVQM